MGSKVGKGREEEEEEEEGGITYCIYVAVWWRWRKSDSIGDGTFFSESTPKNSRPSSSFSIFSDQLWKRRSFFPVSTAIQYNVGSAKRCVLKIIHDYQTMATF